MSFITTLKESRKPKVWKDRFKKLWLWLRKNYLNRQMIVPAILGELTYWSPLIVVGLMAILISPNYWVVFGSIYTFWVFILPAIPIQLAFIALYKIIITAVRKRLPKRRTKYDKL